MRKWSAILLVWLLLISLTACGAGKEVESGIASSTPLVDASSVSTKTEAPSSSTTAVEEMTTTTSGKAQGKPSINKPTTTTTTVVAAVTQTEKPVTINTAILWDEQHSSYDAKAEKKRLSIVNAKDTVKPIAGKTYYVSYKGNDANDGRTPATAWRSTARVGFNPLLVPEGSVILFERGGVYRGSMTLRTGMSIGAYGSGPKPQLYGSPRNYADESLWQKTKTANVWRVSVGDVGGDIGNIIFDYGKKLSAPGKKFSSNSKLAKDYEFYHDVDKGYVYVYLSKGNPGKLHESIEIATHDKVISGRLIKNITIDNLCIKYARFGIGIDRVTDLAITNCEIGYIGGNATYDADGVPKGRIGNGIELFNAIENIRVENNWIYQCYDAGYTNQGHAGDQKAIRVRENLIEYCNYNIEVFTSDDDMVSDTVYENNILRFAGYGFGSYARLGSDCSMVGHVCSWRGAQKSVNFLIRNNVFDVSAYQLISSDYTDGVNGPGYVGNTWIQKKNAKAYAVHTRVKATDSKMSYLTAMNQATLESAVATVDKSATVIFED